MPRLQQHDDENDPELAEIHKMLDDAEDDLDLHGTVSAEDLRSGLEEIYARKRAEKVEQQRARFVQTINEAHDDADREGAVSAEEFGRMLDSRRDRSPGNLPPEEAELAAFVQSIRDGREELRRNGPVAPEEVERSSDEAIAFGVKDRERDQRAARRAHR